MTATLKIDRRDPAIFDPRTDAVVFSAIAPAGEVTVSVSSDALRKLGEGDPIQILQQYEDLVLSVASKKYDDQEIGSIVWVEAIDLVGG